MAAKSSNIKDYLATNNNKFINLTSSSESWPRKAELMCTHSFKKRNYVL